MSRRRRTARVARTLESSEFALNAGNQRDLLVFRQERALAGIEYDAREIVGPEAKCGVRKVILVSQGDPVGQGPIGIQRDHDALLVVARKWMLADTGHHMRVHVARQAHLQRDLARDDLLEERRILAEPRTVTDALRPDVVDGLPD